MSGLHCFMAWPSDAQRSFSLSCGARISLGCRHCWFRGASQHNWKRRDDVTVAMCFPIAARWSRLVPTAVDTVTSLTTSCEWPAWCSDDGILRDNYSLQWLLCAEGWVYANLCQISVTESTCRKRIIEDFCWRCRLKVLPLHLKNHGSLFFWKLGAIV